MTPDKLALKQATAAMVKGVGGVEAAAEFCRVGKTVIAANYSPNEPESFMALDVIADLEPLAREREGWPHVTRALARSAGFALVPLPEGVTATADLHGLLAELGREFSDASTALLQALPDGIDESEARQVFAECDQVIRVAMRIQAAMREISGGGR